MNTGDFETEFSAFLERTEYDCAENALFLVVRNAFMTGWRAAGGALPQLRVALQTVQAQPQTLEELPGYADR